MTATLTDVASKLAALKQRKDEVASTDKAVDALVRTWAPEEAPPSQGCFSKLRICPSWMAKGSRVATKEPSGADASALAASGAPAVRQSGDSHRLLDRLVGTRKQQASETDKIQTAIQAVQLRFDSLSDRVKLGRERALAARQAGRQEEAVRELRKAKALEKQLTATRQALDTLERQQDMIAETALQRELATALKSTTANVKAKNKGLLSLAEAAIDESVEVRDDVEDVAAVFEGMAPAYENVADEDELLAELEELAATTTPVAAAEPAPVAPSVVTAFPSVPHAESSARARQKQERLALLSEEAPGL